MFYKHGNAFASDIKRQIKTVRATVKARQRAAGAPEIGPCVLEPHRLPLIGGDGKPVIEDGPGGVPRPVMITKMLPVPARIAPREYHRLGGVS